MSRNSRFLSIALALAIALTAFAGIGTGRRAWGQETGKKAMPKGPEFHTMAVSEYGFDDTVEMLKGAIEKQNLMVIHEINAQKMLRMVGVQTKGMKQLLFFHPRYMKLIRGANPNGAIEAPLKILVMERPDGKVIVRYVKPTYLFGRYDGLEEIGEELESVVGKIVETATK